MKTRTLTALVLAPLAIALILFVPTVIFAAITGGVFLYAVWEWTRLLGLRQPATRSAFVALHGLAMFVLWLERGGTLWWAVIATGLAWWLAAALWLRHFSFAVAPTRENTALKLAAGFLIVVPAWCGLLQVHGAADHGPWWTLFGLMLVWVADSGAYLAGSRWGRTKLAPRISPGKTWEGVVGGLVGVGVYYGLLWWAWSPSFLADTRLLDLAIVAGMTVLSIEGDLFESWLKRRAGVKDSGTILPGHGGVLDRIDGVVAALPFAALLSRIS